MIGVRRGKGFARMIQMFTRARSAYFSGFVPTCAICRGMAKGASNPLGLCTPCFQSIPWIIHVRCEICGRYEDCYDCNRRHNASFERNRSAVYYNEVMKEWLGLYKYRGSEKLLPVMAGMLLHAYHKQFDDQEMKNNKFDWITYVPLSQERLRERGFNQAEQLAAELGRRVDVPVVSLLCRVRHTHKQSFKSRAERLEDMSGAFSIDPQGLELLHKRNLTGKLRILVVDDVYTTGSTLQQCSEVLSQAINAKVYGLTWAR